MFRSLAEMLAKLTSERRQEDSESLLQYLYNTNSDAHAGLCYFGDVRINHSCVLWSA